MTVKNQYRVPLILMTVLFFLWGFAHNLNPILIPHLKKACQLTDLQSSLIDSAFFIGYFVTAMPAGILMKRLGYKVGILTGLLLFACGAFLFYPASESRLFGLFLVALFVIASGLTFLETAANPYVTVLGHPATATQRLNLSQAFNGLAATLAPLLGGVFILSGDTLSEAQKARMSPNQLAVFLTKEAATVQVPYLVIGGVVLLVAVWVAFTHLPDITEAGDDPSNLAQDNRIWHQRNLMWGIVAQFFYVGGQVCIASFFIRFVKQTAGIDEKTGAFYLSISLLAFMIGRFVGTWLMRFIAPAQLLAVYALLNVVLLAFAVWVGGMAAVYALMAVQFFMSIMFPTIFSLSIHGLGSNTKLGSSLVIMAIAGGAVFPVIMGRISDVSSIQWAYLVPALCFLVVLYFALKTTANQSVTAEKPTQLISH